MFKNTIDGLLASISSKVAKLHKVADAHNADAEVHRQNMVDSQQMHAVAISEAGRARRIAAKFAELIS